MKTNIDYARSPERNNAADFIADYVSDWSEIHGDRLEGDDYSVMCGIGRLGDMTLAIAAQYPGRTMEERMHARGGMTQPMGYRKIHRLMAMASQFSLPLLLLIDTPGADAGLDACKKNQSKAIADSLLLTATYPHPSIAMILNQGMSGGAMALAMADHLWMSEHAIFSVISPEGCAKILWHDVSLASRASEKLKITASELLGMNIIDKIIPDDFSTLSFEIQQTFLALALEPSDVRMEKRYKRWDVR